MSVEWKPRRSEKHGLRPRGKRMRILAMASILIAFGLLAPVFAEDVGATIAGIVVDQKGALPIVGSRYRP